MSWAIWVTGLPGSGKSVLTRRAAADLRSEGVPVTVLELDEIRKVLTPFPSYSDAERELVYRALVHLSTTLTDCGRPVIIDATAHRRVWRERARTAIARFAEVELRSSLEVCRQREEARVTDNAHRHISAGAGRPGAAVPGVDVAYEHSRAPELVIDTSVEDIPDGAARIVALARRLAPDDAQWLPAAAVAWAMWITGLPGSGKTTLAFAVADTLSAGGTPVRVLDLGQAREAVAPDGPYSAAGDEIVHRTLAYTAKLLTDAGIAVIVDAIAPRRAWRTLARELIGHFAEVQLACPAEICIDRERAVRWNASAAARTTGGQARMASPDIVFDYEPALNPDLTIYTDVQAPWTAVDEALALARRLIHVAARRGDADSPATSKSES
jgi:adenylylsulfate kinase